MSTFDILQLNAYDGPNIYGPQPGVRLRARCDRDRSQRLRAALKDGAQAIGLMIAQLAVATRAAGAGFVVEAVFASEAPDVGAALCEYIAAGIVAEAADDAEWDGDTPLLALAERRRHTALPVAALQLVAEARQRGIPTLRLANGHILLGQGQLGQSFDPATLAPGAAPAIAWERLGRVPLHIVTGAERRAVIERCASELAATGLRPRVLDGADYAATAALLSAPTTAAAVIGLDSAAILRRGVAFDRCDRALITAPGPTRPPEAADDDEWLRALGVPMLLSDAPAQIDLAAPALQALIPYAPYGVVGI